MQARDKHALRRFGLSSIAGQLAHVGIDVILLFDVAPIFHAHVVLDRVHERHGVEAAVELLACKSAIVRMSFQLVTCTSRPYSRWA